MPRKKMKQEIKKPDFLQTTFQLVLEWTKGHRTVCIAGAVVALLVVLAVWGYGTYGRGGPEGAVRALPGYEQFPRLRGRSEKQRPLGGGRELQKGGRRKLRGLKGYRKTLSCEDRRHKRHERGNPASLLPQINKNPSNDVMKKLSGIGLRESGTK